MANDFKIKNGLQLGGAFVEKVGTISGNADVDLSTGNVFDYTPTADATFTFSNAGETEHSFVLSVAGAEVGASYDIANAVYDSVSFTLNSFQASNPIEIIFNPDGTMFFAQQDERIQRYNLSTSWDVTTASYSNLQIFTAGTAGGAKGCHFKPDGSKFYFVSSTTEAVYEYNLASNWDLSTASLASNFSFSSLSTNVTGLTFKSDGSAFYVSSALGGEAFVFEFSLSTNWDVSTASFLRSVDFATILGSQFIERIFFGPDGLNLFAVEAITFNAAYKIPLSSAWDLTSASSAVSFSFSNEDANITSFTFKDDGLKMYSLGFSTKNVYQYTTGTAPAPATFTYPASVAWPSGTAPDAPAVGETDILEFSTTDGGTTWYCVRTGDAIA